MKPLKTGRTAMFVALGLIAMATSACYRYVPVESPAPGIEVRVRVPVRTTVGGGATVTETAALDGHIVEWGDTLLLETTSRQQIGNFREVVLVDTVRLDMSQLESVERRELSTRRTVIATGATLGALGLILLATETLTGGSPGDDGEGNGTTQGNSIVLTPFFSWALRLFGR